ncbi:3-phosphoshikimate 1-carboxyvinyltransferase [Stetteria hydrogenophila]
MILRVRPARRVEGSVQAPPSKSYTHRALFASLLACGESMVRNPLVSGDTEATLSAVERLGARLEWTRGAVRVQGACGRPEPPAWIYCAGSGTTLRIATTVSSLVGEPVLLYGNETLRRRPMKPLLDALAGVGVESLSRDGYPPVAVRGPPGRGRVRVDARHSSQFATALLFIAPVAGLEVEAIGPVASRPYLDVTLRVLEAYGARFYRDGYEYFAPRGLGLRGAEFRVPGDYSSAAFMLALGAIAGRVRVEGLDPGDGPG